MRRFQIAVLLVAISCTPADRSAGAPGGGTLVISTAGDPNSLFPPFVGTVQGRQVTDLVYDRLASLGDSLRTIGDGGFIPGLARSWTWSPDSLRITFHLDPSARWHDGVPVTSSDVKFTLAAYRDSIVASDVVPLIASIDSITAPDSATAVFWFHAKSPEQFYDATDNMSILPEHIWKKISVANWRSSDQARHPIGSGQFRFTSWTQGEALTIVADTANYRGRPKLDRVIWSIAPDFNTALARFLGGQTDFFEAVRADIIPQITRNPDLRILTAPGVQYSFLQFNLKDSLFADRELRRALTMAVDRNAIVRSVYDSLALPALPGSIRAFPTTDATIPAIPFDTAAAARTLDSLGWRVLKGRSVRWNSGRPLSFDILVPSSSKARMQMAVLIQEQLRKIGVGVSIHPVEFPTFIARTEKHDYEAAINSINSDPSPSGARQDWETMGIKTGNNIGSYSNPAFDALVDSALASYDFATRRSLLNRAYRIIAGDAPAIWLAEPKMVIAVHRRIRVVGLRPDAWWQHVGEWWIPPGERIPRDFARAAVPAVTDSQRKTQ